MRIGVVSDIHGNVEALEYALDLMGAVERLFALGDCIDEFRFSEGVVAILRERDALTIRGNHEHAFFAGPGASARRAGVSHADHAAWLEDRPGRAELDLLGKRLLLAHSTSWSSDFDYVPPSSPKFSRFAESGADIVLYGHTHVPVVRLVGSTLVINPGSVGLGRPSERGFVQSCAVLDLAATSAEILEFQI